VLIGWRDGVGSSDSLTDFLRQAGVPIPVIERTWRALAKRRVHSVPRIALTPAQLEALGL
jgi:hypothetical protein